MKVQVTYKGMRCLLCETKWKGTVWGQGKGNP